MALNFGQSFFQGREDDGTFARKNIQINKSLTTPELQSIGDMCLWEEEDGGVYDEYNSIIDLTKWSFYTEFTQVGTGTVTFDSYETDTYIASVLKFGIAGGTYNAGWHALHRIYTDIMPNRNLYDTLEFSILVDGFGGYGSGEQATKVDILGITVYNQDQAVRWFSKTFRMEKNADNTWNCYIDDVLVLSDQAATGNQISIQFHTWYNATFGAGGHDDDIRVYNINLGRRVAFVIKGTDRTYIIPLISVI